MGMLRLDDGTPVYYRAAHPLTAAEEAGFRRRVEADRARLAAAPPAARDLHDHYPTPLALACAVLARYAPPGVPARILDPGAGTGIWGLAARLHYGARPALHGVELFPLPPAPGYTAWTRADFLQWRPPTRYDLVVGTPPDRGLLPFVGAALTHLAPGGHCLLLLRLAELPRLQRAGALWPGHPPAHLGLCVSRPRAGGGGGPDSAVVHWVAGGRGPTVVEVLSFEF